MMQTIAATPVAQPHACTAPVPVSCCKERDTPCPWTATTWDYDYEELWKAWATGTRDGPGRVSCSSIESNSSMEEYLLREVDDNNNESTRLPTTNNNNNSTTTTRESSSQVDGVATTTTSSSSSSSTNEAKGKVVQEDTTNNNTVAAPAANDDDDDRANNNSAPVTPVKCSSGSSSKKGEAASTNSKNATPGRTRLLDEDGFIRRAACVCVDETESKVLLVSSKKDPCSWLVPGGGVEDGEETPIAAMREAWEEAGVQGHITKYLGLFETQQKEGRKRHRTAVFVILVKEILAQYPEAHLGRRREWFSLDEGLAHLSRNRPLQSVYLKHLKAT